MDNLSKYRELIEQILAEHARIPFSHGNFESKTVFDRTSDRYLLMLVGWEENDVRRVHGCLVHVDIINGKFWIQRDGTEYGVGQELLDAGVPKDHLVLAFRSVEKRKYTDFAVS